MGGGGRFNVNKIHNSFQFISQNVYFCCNFTAVISKRAIKVGKRRFSVTKRESADAITTTK